MAKKIKHPKKPNRAERAARKMPPLSDWPDRSQEFDQMKSDVRQWIMQQPEVWEWYFDTLKARGHIVFWPELKLWAGADWTPENAQEAENEGENIEGNTSSQKPVRNPVIQS